MSSELIFVTGASGFLGAHIVDQLLNKGYRVRAAARGAKVDFLKHLYAQHKDHFDAVNISDIATGEFPEALEGVDAVIHTASPLPDKASKDVILEGAVNGTVNIIRQAQKAGIKRLIVTSSIASVSNPQKSFTDKDWNPLTREEALKGTDMATYSVSKTLAERALWDFAAQHKELDITTLNPPFFYGPFAPGFTIPELNYGALTTDAYIYRLLDPAGSYPSSPYYIDVRDVARAHVAALTSPPESSVGRKRLLIASPYDSNFQGVVELIAAKRPELKNRLITSKPPVFPSYKLPVDLKRVEDVLDIKVDSYKKWEETILDAVDSLIELENTWKAKGYNIVIPKA
ncbi:hypothetical protein PILCRDRAFT_440081 [Piloderma croceum F 1598]|uniref:NAD-dependent epimerase/dehydratase domain-containing protein n=1 Tax=Piloderma croceum (strain F 1598) TaxID=765440 RepID=A0A0C3FFY6_PILCF|nr:hypothetical protein PILCRDRAFT_440081 [Piloderma croceum F 1598]